MKPSTSPRGRRSRAGFSLIELLIVIGLAGIVAVNAARVVRSSGDLVALDASRMMLEDNARIVVERVADAVRTCDRDTLTPIVPPLDSSQVTFQRNLGIQGTAIVMGPVERIELTGPAGDRLVWRESPGTPDERSVTWSRTVADLLEGETVNAADDNGNGLVDERGLSILVEGNLVTVRLTLGKTLSNGQPIVSTVERTVAVRNRPLD